MDDTAKMAASAAAGILIGKIGGSAAWWLLGGATVLFIMKSPTTQSYIKSGAKKAYAAGREAYAARKYR